VIITRPRADWAAQRLEAHEWGVSEYDWSNGKKPSGVLPDFVYTEDKPGDVTPRPGARVKEMGADSGIRVRTKPILYFYAPDTLRKKFEGRPAIPVAVEARFREGYAHTWWPQVSVFRNREEVRGAQAPDVGIPPFPDDRRFQLVWDHLEVSPVISAKQKLRGENLPESHWLKIARQVDSAYVSNGREVEKFLFYEGNTQEIPAIAIIPQDRFSVPRFLVYNVSDYPIHDPFLIYRNKAKRQFWVRYFSRLAPLPRRSARENPAGPESSANVLSPAIPHFEDLERDETFDESEFHRITELKLGSILRMEYPVADTVYSGRRNPAQYQPPTEEYRLFPLELAALERIWNRTFFGDDGLTILYRESPVYLDQAAPLHIFTDMEHYVNLSRCSLVVNRKVDLFRIRQNSELLRKALSELKDESTGLAPEMKRSVSESFAKEPLGTLTELEYLARVGGREKLLIPVVTELRERLAK